MNNTEIIFVAIGTLIGILLFGSTGKKISDKIYEHKKVKPSDWYTKTRKTSKYIMPNKSNPVVFDSAKWPVPRTGFNDMPPISSGGTRNKRNKINKKHIKKSR